MVGKTVSHYSIIEDLGGREIGGDGPERTVGRL